MRTKFFVLNKDNKIEFTEYELKQLLDEIYDTGYNDGKYRTYVYTTPSYPLHNWYKYKYPSYITTCTTTTADASNIVGSSSTAGNSINIKGTKTVTYKVPNKSDTSTSCKEE